MKVQNFKRGTLFLFVCLSLMLSVFQGVTYGQTVLSIDPAGVASPEAGEQFVIDVHIGGAPAIEGYEFNLIFDPTALEFVGVDFTGYLPGDQSITDILDSEIILIRPRPMHVKIDSDTGLASFVGRSIAAFSLIGAGVEAGTLVHVTFNVLEKKDSEIQIVNVIIPDPESAELNSQLPVTTVDGIISSAFAELPTAGGVADDVEKSLISLSGATVHEFILALDVGLNMIALPLMTEQSFTAQTFAEALGATIVIRLDTVTNKFDGYTRDQDSAGFDIEGGKGYIVNVPEGGTITFRGTGWDNVLAPGIMIGSEAWAFVVSVSILNTYARKNYTVIAQNVRTESTATDRVSVTATSAAAVWADLSGDSVVEVGDVIEVTVVDEGGNIASGPHLRTVGLTDVRQAYLRLSVTMGDVNPGQTRLAQNFSNPFNPETWMPFQLDESSFAVIQIHNAYGDLVRILNLGVMPAGFYKTQSTAAYWDGCNGAGEKAAAGVYFYTLKAADYTATRKMLIAK